MALSLAAQRILRVMLDAPTDEHYGLALMSATGLKSGSLYPALSRLEKKSLVERRWEDIDPSAEGRPRRRLYRLTPDGVVEARRILNETAVQLGFSPRMTLR
jgi:PadR family transcriptional regulator, regulatory protein PadR